MRKRPSVVHLIDDTTAGGVMRVLDHIETSPDMAALAQHRVVTVPRGQVQPSRFDADVIVSHLSISWRTLPALLAMRIANHGKPCVHVEHSYTEGFVRHNVPNIRRFNALLGIGFSLFDGIAAVSNAQADWFRRNRYCSDHKLFTIRSCVDLSAFKALQPKRSGPKVIGAIGRLDRQKGFEILIRGFRALPHPDVALHIHGTGDAFDQLRALADGDPRIVFKGFCRDPVRAYEAADVIVVPSRWEAYGLVAIEALCANRKVLCANVDGLKDHEEYGATLFDAQSKDAITQALANVLSERPSTPLPRETSIADGAQAAFVSGWESILASMTKQNGVRLELKHSTSRPQPHRFTPSKTRSF